MQPIRQKDEYSAFCALVDRQRSNSEAKCIYIGDRGFCSYNCMAHINLSFAFKEDLQNLRNNLSKFSITLFGRTMAGKSTLMEILTEGDGKSIGTGAQRTIRDVRKYTW